MRILSFTKDSVLVLVSICGSLLWLSFTIWLDVVTRVAMANVVTAQVIRGDLTFRQAGSRKHWQRQYLACR